MRRTAVAPHVRIPDETMSYAKGAPMRMNPTAGFRITH